MTSTTLSVTAARSRGLFLWLALLQIPLWAALAVLFQNSIENDVAEGAVDGPALQLSYLRHPPLSSWVTGLAERTGPARYWALYGAALAFACLAFVFVARWIAQREGAAAGWVALAGGLMSPYGSYWPIKFNHNIGIMPFWALTLVAGWTAFETEGIGGWLFLGAAVGCGLWAKYAILHLALPLAAFFLFEPRLRAKLATPGPWVSIALAALIASPHIFDAIRKGGSTFEWAVHASPISAGARIEGIIEFLLGAALANATFALIALVACGPRAWLNGLRRVLWPPTQTAFDRYLLFAAIGPVVVIAAAGPFGVRLFYHWITPVSLSFAAFWGTVAARGGLREISQTAQLVYAGWVAATALGFVAVREITPFVIPKGSAAYGEMDADGLDRVVDAYWRNTGGGPMHYIVSLGGKGGFEAAGSYEFDHGGRVEVLKDADQENAPWLNERDIVRLGALLISGVAPPSTVMLKGQERPITDLQELARPLTRAHKPGPRLWLGRIAPAPD